MSSLKDALPKPTSGSSLYTSGFDISSMTYTLPDPDTTLDMSSLANVLPGPNDTFDMSSLMRALPDLDAHSDVSSLASASKGVVASTPASLA